MGVNKYRLHILGLCLLLLLSQGCTSSKTGNKTAIITTSAYTASAADIKAGNQTVANTASAIQAKDVKVFTSLMSRDLLSRVKGDPDLTSPEALVLADGLRNARIIKTEADAFTYEITVNGTKITFLVIKEDGAWKISGL
jgi:hypothetical protein